MPRWLTDRRAVWSSRGILAAVFLAYGMSKIPYLSAFATSIHNYRMLPVQAENVLAIVLPWIEVVAALALLRRSWLPGGAVVIGGLTVVFIVAIASAIVRGLDINCGCFTLSETSPMYGNLWQHLVLDFALLSMAIHLLWFSLFQRRENEGEAGAP